ncbi:MAG: hypothetical protein MIO92_04970 [Methanosarcinaceae archaeon]|nr:hypothetical protein [Methanosarcinaceae archaeon]
MGQPAARAGDMVKTCNDPTDMPIGSIVAVGTVLINGIPAAKQNDQVVGIDIHIVMVPSPGGPVPTPLPHPFTGILDTKLSNSVKIMGQPAAFRGSIATNQPSHIPTPPGVSFQKPPMNQGEVFLGSVNVMIGNGGGTGSGSGGGSGGSTAAATSQDGTVEEEHTLNVKFVDKGDKPIAGINYRMKEPDGRKSDGLLTGEIKKSDVKEGDYEIELQAITKVVWSTKKAKVGDKVKLKGELAGVKSGTPAEFHIFQKDTSVSDKPYALLEAKTQGDTVEAEWEYQYHEEEGMPEVGRDKIVRYSFPQFYYFLKVAGMQQKSGLMELTDELHIELKDDKGDPIPNEEYEVYLSSGEVRKGTLDKSGKAIEKNIPTRQCRVVFPNTVKAKKLPQ